MTLGSAPPREPLRDVAIYNPDLLRKEELVAYFIARRPLLERILEDLRTSGSAQHHLLIGTRGMGKTTLLKRIRFAVEDDAGLAADWLPLTFPEEQYSVTRLSDLYLNCVDALSDALEERGRRTEAKALDAEVAALTQVKEEERSRRALALLLGAADAVGKRLVLLLDNIDILFDRLKAQAWALRELLSREERLVIVGASASHPEETYTYDAPFYDFFKVHELRGLPEIEARELLLHLADLRGATHVRRVVEAEKARVRTMHTLSGGNPRTLVLLFFLLAQSTQGDAQEDLERLLDHITPLYKARVEALSTQAQKIVDTIAIHWHPITAAETAVRTQLEVGLVSSQITRLVREGVLERCASPERTRSAYQVAERLLNIWYLMRQSRRVRQRLVWLVEFLRLFYGSEELSSHARAHLGRDLPMNAESRVRHVEYGLALAEAVNDVQLRKALESVAVRDLVADPRLRGQISRIVDIEGADASLQPLLDKHQAAMEVRERVLSANVRKQGWNLEKFAEILGGSMSLSPQEKLTIAGSLEQLQPTQLEDLEMILGEEVERFTGQFRSRSIVESLRRALRDGHMSALDDLDGAHAASIVFRAAELPTLAVVTRFERSPEESLVRLAADLSHSGGAFSYGWYAIGLAWSKLGRFAHAAEAYREAIELEPEYAYPWNGLGNLLQDHLGRYSEAEAAYRKAIEVDPKLAHPWNGLGNVLKDHLGRYSEAEAAYRKAIEVGPKYAHLWNNLGNLLQYRLGRYSEAEAAYRKAIEVDPKDASPWNGLGDLLNDHLGKHSDAEAAHRKATELDPRNPTFWNNFAWCRFLNDRVDEETESAARAALAPKPDDPYSAHTLACILVRRDHWDEAAPLMFSVIQNAPAAYFEKTWPDIVRFFAECVRAGRTKESLAMLDEIGFGERWLPLRAALSATIEGRESLLAIAPELRGPAEKIHDDLLALAGLPASPPKSSPRSRRKERQ